MRKPDPFPMITILALLAGAYFWYEIASYILAHL